MKKKVNFQPSPRCPVCTAVAVLMDVDVSSDADDDMPSPPMGTRKTPSVTIAAFVLPSIKPSPNTDITPRLITPSPGEAAPGAPPTVTQSPLNQAMQITVQTPAPNRKPNLSKSKIMKLDNNFILGARTTTFDASALRGDEVYLSDQMKAHDGTFHRQILFNFSERRGAEKKKDLNTGRVSRSVDVDLDHNAQAYNVETTDHRELS